jgi:alkaline phosphatase D
MHKVTRREFLATATALGATSAWASHKPRPSNMTGTERRDLYPEGVASGDPDSTSVILWTRHPGRTGSRERLLVEVSEDCAFSQVIATETTYLSEASDWTARVLAGNLQPSRTYWYRFIDSAGYSSRTGRTRTAPGERDVTPVRFAFVCCQNINMGELHAYRRMIFEDERTGEDGKLDFVLHLGDFIYEVVWYPEDRPAGIYGRRLRDTVRYQDGEKINDFHIPTSLADYRAAYRAHLHNKDLQNARARWPFVCIWDNHEFSQSGWQSLQLFNGRNRPAQTRKVAANQAWWEYQPARVVKSGGASHERFNPPQVRDVAIERYDSCGLAQESNNRAALASLTAYRSFHWGRNVEIILTDQRSYRSESYMERPEAAALTSEEFPELVPQEALEILDAGQAYAGGTAPAAIRLGNQEIPNFTRDRPPQTILGAEQKKWFLSKLKSSRATWKIWGNTQGTLDFRVDLQNLPPGLTKPWPGSGYACYRGNADYGTAYTERAEIYRTIKDEGIDGFVTLCGDRHAFWAGLASASLPPRAFEPVGVAFVTGSLSTPGLIEHLEKNLPKSHPLRGIYVGSTSADDVFEPVANMLVRHGVRAALEYERTREPDRARLLSNPQLSPHLSFVDLDGHGYSIVRASSRDLECEFVCIPRPAESNKDPDGGAILYRVVHRASAWGGGEIPSLDRHVLEGSPKLSL